MQSYINKKNDVRSFWVAISVRRTKVSISILSSTSGRVEYEDGIRPQPLGYPVAVKVCKQSHSRIFPGELQPNYNSIGTETADI